MVIDVLLMVVIFLGYLLGYSQSVEILRSSSLRGGTSLKKETLKFLSPRQRQNKPDYGNKILKISSYIISNKRTRLNPISRSATARFHPSRGLDARAGVSGLLRGLYFF